MHSCDVLVIGSGAAGLACACYLAEQGFNTTVLTKAAEATDSNSRWAQGGIIYRGPEDSSQSLVQDVLEAGAGLCYRPAVGILAQEGPRVVEELLLAAGSGGFTHEGGELHFTAEGGHSTRRIIHHADETGRQIVTILLEKAATLKNLHLETDRVAVDLITREHHSDDLMARYKKPECFGAYVLDRSNRRVSTYLARAVVLASGGLGQIYLHTTNPDVATGDGIAMALRAGAILINLEYTQFHPTTLFHPRADSFLISEAVRGEGAELVTQDGKPFMHKYHRQGSLAPRDVVTRGILEELVARKEQCVYLDLSAIPTHEIKERFPYIQTRCLEYGIDITSEPIPVVPAFHFSCGGIRVNENARTNLARLYAVGEVSCTGVHGANRLASTSLLECLVWGRRCALDIKQRWETLQADKYPGIPDWQDKGLLENYDPALTNQDWITLRHIMWNYVGPVRSTHRLSRAISDLHLLQESIEEFYRNTRLTRAIIELRNAVAVGRAIAGEAWRNRTPRGCHYRKQ